MIAPFNANVGEINIVCSSLEASLRFYRDVLGFEVLGEEKGCVHLACNGTHFLLLPLARPNDARPAYGSVPTISIDLVVNDLDAARSFLASKDADIIEDTQEVGCFFIRDPDGLVLEIVQAQG